MELDNYPREIKNIWTAEMFKERITVIQNDIKNFSQQINDVNSRMNELIENKRHLQRKISNKAKYLNQLKKHLEERKDWVEL